MLWPLAGADGINDAAIGDLVLATSQVQLDDTATPPGTDSVAPAAAEEPKTDAAPKPEQRMSFYEGSIIAVRRPLCHTLTHVADFICKFRNDWILGPVTLAMPLLSKEAIQNPETLELSFHLYASVAPNTGQPTYHGLTAVPEGPGVTLNPA